MAHCVVARAKTRSAAVHWRLHPAIGFFNRRFRGNQQQDEAMVALAIAFEFLLADGWQGRGGTKSRVVRRVGLRLADHFNGGGLERGVRRLLERRGGIVHEGDSEIALGLNPSLHAFVHWFDAVEDRLPALSETAARPVGGLLGDPGEPVLPPRRRWLIDRLCEATEAAAAVSAPGRRPLQWELPCVACLQQTPVRDDRPAVGYRRRRTEGRINGGR